jgi:hypothetical protein
MISDLAAFQQKLQDVFGAPWEETEAQELFKGYQLASIIDAVDSTNINTEEKRQIKQDFTSEEKAEAAVGKAIEVTASLSKEVKAQIAIQALKRIFLSLLQRIPLEMIEPAQRFAIEDKIEALTE